MDNEYIASALEAGRIAAEALQYGKSLVVPGGSYRETYDAIVAFIIEKGGFPAFPPQLSFDDTAAHFMIGPDEDITFSDQLVKVDIGVCVDGAIGDNALTVDLSGKHSDLVSASRNAVEKIAAVLRVGMTLNDVGQHISDVISAAGFVPVVNLSGHGLGHYLIHTSPQLPNVPNGDMTEIAPGMHFAVEPFASVGAGMIYEKGDAHIFSLQKGRAIRSPQAKRLYSLLKQKYSTLPFSSIDAYSLGMSPAECKLGLAMLLRADVIHAYPPLVDRKNGFVSQAEHSFLVDLDGKVHVTTKLD